LIHANVVFSREKCWWVRLTEVYPVGVIIAGLTETPLIK